MASTKFNLLPLEISGKSTDTLNKGWNNTIVLLLPIVSPGFRGEMSKS
jgi:hypothetical protein